MSPEMFRRVSRVVRLVETQERAGNMPGARARVPNVIPTATAKITGEEGSGLYTAEEVRWTDDGGGVKSWETFAGGRVWDSNNPVLEKALTTGVGVDTIVTLEQRSTYFPPTTTLQRPVTWMFTLGGGGSTVLPGQIKSKVTDNGNTNEYLIDVWTAGRFEDDGTVITPAPVIDATCFIWQVSGSYTIPTETWLPVTAFGNHYEGQIPIWLC